MILFNFLSFALLIPLIQCSNIFIPAVDPYTDISGRQVNLSWQHGTWWLCAFGFANTTIEFADARNFKITNSNGHSRAPWSTQTRTINSQKKKRQEQVDKEPDPRMPETRKMHTMTAWVWAPVSSQPRRPYAVMPKGRRSKMKFSAKLMGYLISYAKNVKIVGLVTSISKICC